MSKEKLPVFTMSLMVTGNLLGAGILALPINLGPAGMLPASLGIVAVWLLMLYSSFVLADQKELVEGDTGGLPSFFGYKLGPSAKWLAVVADLIILYGVLTAYLTGTTTILVNLFNLPLPDWAVNTVFFALVAGLTSFGIGLLRRCNAFILITMGLTFAILLGWIFPHVDPAEAMPMQWGFLPAALPVVLTAFLYHNLIPTVCRELKQDRRAIRKTMFIGSAIGLVMNLSWTVVVFCSLPAVEGPVEQTIEWAFVHNLPATIPLSKMLGSQTFTDIGLVFAILSMTAAFMANGMALRCFLLDLTDTYLKTRNAALIWVLAFIPPYLVSTIYPDVFLVAMNIVGGIGVCIIFGVLPSMLLLKGGRKTRLGGVVMLVMFGFILVCTVAQETGLTHIEPNVTYWIFNAKLPNFGP